MAKDSNERLNIAVHGLRGIASLMVFFGHILGGSADHIYPDNEAFVSATLPYWNIGVFGPYLFFIISGFVIFASAMEHGPRKFALRRFMRIYPLFFVMTVLFVTLNLITNRQPDLNDPLTIFAGFTFLNLFTGTEPLTPNAWSLTYEAIFYVLACAGVYYTLTVPNRVVATILFLLSALFVFMFPKALFFVAGVLIRILFDRMVRLRGPVAWVVEIAAFAGMVGFVSLRHHSYYQDSMSDPVAWAALFCATIYFFAAVNRESITTLLVRNPVFFYFGTVSYSLYLVHPYTYLATRIAFEKLGLFTANTTSSVLLFGVVAFIITIPITHVIYMALERWPYARFFRKGVYEKPIAAPEANRVQVKLS